MLNAGFTMKRDPGNNANYADTALRVAIEQGLIPGPNDEIVKAVRRNILFGAKVIKICVDCKPYGSRCSFCDERWISVQARRRDDAG